MLDEPARRCPTTSARLPFLTLVMKAPSLPVSVIFPPTTCTQRRRGHKQCVTFSGWVFFVLLQLWSFCRCDPALDGRSLWGPAGSRPPGARPTSCSAWCVRSGGHPLWMAAMTPGAAGEVVRSRVGDKRWESVSIQGRGKHIKASTRVSLTLTCHTVGSKEWQSQSPAQRERGKWVRRPGDLHVSCRFSVGVKCRDLVALTHQPSLATNECFLGLDF